MAVSVANTTADLSGKTLLKTEDAQTITGLKTFDRGASAPFAVVIGGALVPNLDADKLDGQEGAYYTNLANLTGLLNSTAHGTHNLVASGPTGHVLTVRNTLAGVSAFSGIYVGNDGSASNLYMQSFSTTYATSGPNIADGGIVAAERAGGLSLGAYNAAGAIRFYTGGPNLRLTIPSNAAGITFPAAQAASADPNTLDDYEEGIWTPADNSGAGLVFTNVLSSYIKIGQFVMACMALTYPSTANGANASISGLPFVSQSIGNSIFGSTINYTTATQNLTGFVQNNGAVVHLYQVGGAAQTNANMSLKELRLTAYYRASS